MHDYVFSLSGHARVKVRAFGVTLAGVGLEFAFGFDTRTAGLDGRVKIELKVRIVVDLWLFEIDETAYFTIGYLQLPKKVYMGSDGSSTLVDGVLYRNWNITDTPRALYLNAGPRDAARNIGVGDTAETFVIEQVGGSATNATIKVTAFGRSNTYEHVNKIVGDFDAGNDVVIIKQGVLVPLDIKGGAGSDVITSEGVATSCDPNTSVTFENSTCSKIDGGGDNDFITAAGDVWMRGGSENDILTHAGTTGRGRLEGGTGDDTLFGSTVNDRLYGEAGKDVLTGPASYYDGGTEDDRLVIAFTGTLPTSMTVNGGEGNDVVVATFGPGSDVVEIGSPTDTAFTLGRTGSGQAVTQVMSNVEQLNLDLGAGADSLLVKDVEISPLAALRVDLGRKASVNGIRIETMVVKDSSGTVISTYDREVPDVRYSDDGATDTVVVEGSTGADAFTVDDTTADPDGAGPDLGDGTPAVRVTAAIKGSVTDYVVDLWHPTAGRADSLTVRSFVPCAPEASTCADGADSITAKDLGQDLVALTLSSGDGGDTVVGSSFADVIDSGRGATQSPAVTGWTASSTGAPQAAVTSTPSSRSSTATSSSATVCWSSARSPRTAPSPRGSSSASTASSRRRG